MKTPPSARPRISRKGSPAFWRKENPSGEGTRIGTMRGISIFVLAALLFEGLTLEGLQCGPSPGVRNSTPLLQKATPPKTKHSRLRKARIAPPGAGVLGCYYVPPPPEPPHIIPPPLPPELFTPTGKPPLLEQQSTK